MTAARRKICELDAQSIAFYRRNPCIACEDLLGIKLFDAQKYILESSWNAAHCVWACSRNFGKSFIGAVFLILKAILYENQSIYIVSSVGDQAKETFTKIEEIVRRIGKTSASIKSLKDIVEQETVKTSTNKTGFSHNPAGYEVSFYNGSSIFTLNSNPDNNRSRRATLVFFDEAAFCSDELITVCEAFATQNTEFVTSTEDGYDPRTETRKVPTQLVYASSQDEMTKTFYKHYKNFAKRMLAGDRNYFVCDMICDVAITTYMNGEPYSPLLTRAKVDAALKSNREKALREYFNKPTMDGGSSQIIKWGTVRRNEHFYLPELHWTPGYKYIIAFDPSRTGDNSIVGVMKLYDDPKYGLCGDIVNCVNMIDTASKKKYKLDSNRQIANLREMLLDYNGQNPDYEYINSLEIDQGAGGGGTSTYADGLLNDWQDKMGNSHRGLIDKSHEIYEGYTRLYPNASDKLRLISPRKYRTQMVEELIELMDLGVFRFPHEYGGQDFIKVFKTDGEEESYETYELNEEERMALMQIDLMKTEITSIHKTQNAEKTSVVYALAREKTSTMHDDRFYVAILLAHRLYELRRGKAITSRPKQTTPTADFFTFKAPQLYKYGKK